MHHMQTSTITVPEVSFLPGYDDAKWCYRAFRAWTGSTPGQRRLSNTLRSSDPERLSTLPGGRRRGAIRLPVFRYGVRGLSYRVSPVRRFEGKLQRQLLTRAKLAHGPARLLRALTPTPFTPYLPR